MSSKNCAGCMNVFKSRECLKCRICHSWYDLLCANVSERQFKAMSVEIRGNWTCPGCRSKEPKIDNTNTPIRTKSPSLTQYSPTSNVNIRSRSAPSDKTCNDAVIEITRRELRDIVKQEIETALKVLVSDEFRKINESITSFQQSLSFFNEQYEAMRSTLEDRSAKILQLEKDNRTLQDNLNQLAKRTNLLEQHARSANIEIQCVPEHKSENLVSTILQLSNVVKCDIKDTDIQICTRVAKKDTQSKRPRSIMVKFCSPRLRDSFLAATMKFNRANVKCKLNTSHLGIGGDKPQPIYVAEHLSPENKALHGAARTRAKELGFKFVWVRNGRILMKKSESSETFVVTNLETLKNLN